MPRAGPAETAAVKLGEHAVRARRSASPLVVEADSGPRVEPHDIWPLGPDSCVSVSGQDSLAVFDRGRAEASSAPLGLGALSGGPGVPFARDCSCAPCAQVFWPASAPSGGWFPSSWDASIRALMAATPRPARCGWRSRRRCRYARRPCSEIPLDSRGFSGCGGRRRRTSGWYRQPALARRGSPCARRRAAAWWSARPARRRPDSGSGPSLPSRSTRAPRWFPARAGMEPGHSSVWSSTKLVPRARGDGAENGRRASGHAGTDACRRS